MGNNLTSQYIDAVKQIKTAILQSQLRASKAVNTEQLALYYGIGKFVSHHSREGKWGTDAINTISEQLQKELPGLKGFSPTSIKKMRQFYEKWSVLVNRPPMAGDLQGEENHDDINCLKLLELNRPPMANDLSYQDFFALSFSHHDEILSKTSTIEERIFYIHEASIHKWDKYTLRDQLKADLFHHQGQMPNNFAKAISNSSLTLKAIEMFKDEYLLDFINVEELCVRDEADIDEKVVENAIVQNVKKFILAFGKDFTFVGNQYHLEMYGENQWADLLFYNRELKSLVCFELKRGKFKPSYLGQLSAYLRVLDANVKKPDENPSIGILLCKEANKSFVEFVIQGYDNPMGVATYKEKLMKLLPDQEELTKLLEEE